jgi:hypothetical protein
MRNCIAEKFGFGGFGAGVVSIVGEPAAKTGAANIIVASPSMLKTRKRRDRIYFAPHKADVS